MKIKGIYLNPHPVEEYALPDKVPTVIDVSQAYIITGCKQDIDGFSFYEYDGVEPVYIRVVTSDGRNGYDICEEAPYFFMNCQTAEKILNELYEYDKVDLQKYDVFFCDRVPIVEPEK